MLENSRLYPESAVLNGRLGTGGHKILQVDWKMTTTQGARPDNQAYRGVPTEFNKGKILEIPVRSPSRTLEEN